jgi:geranylgeranyl diphosphate synthase, type I
VVATPSLLGRYRAELEEALRAAIPAGGPDLLYRMMRYHLGWEDEQGLPLTNAGGKGLRAALCLWACEAVGGPWRRALPAAVALELIHNFSLVHDDIQDGDVERRHRPTVWSVWGAPQAINAGDSLLVLGRRALLGLHEEGPSAADSAIRRGGVRMADRTGLPAPRVLLACLILDEACRELIEGQCLDLGFEATLDVSPEAYLEMIGKKTGALLEASLHLGALAGSEDNALAGRLARCGRLLGLAFQIRDDILGVWGASEITGKPVAADIHRRKKCLPVVYTLAVAQDRAREDLLRLYAQDSLSDGDVARVLEIVESSTARDYCQRMAEERIAEALAELKGAAISSAALRDFQELTIFLLERDF